MQLGSIVRTVRIQGQTSGIKEAAAETRDLARAQGELGRVVDATAKITDTASRRQQSSSRLYSTITAEMAGASRAAAVYARSIQAVEQAEARGESVRAAAAARRFVQDRYQNAPMRGPAIDQSALSATLGLRNGGQGSARASAAVFEEEAKRQEAAATYAASGWNRLSAAGREAMTAIDRTKSADEASRRIAGMGMASVAASKGVGLASHQLSNLSFQINDVATMAALGAPPLQILASQAGQFIQIFQQSPGGALAAIRGLLTSPLALWAGGFLAAGAAALYFFRTTDDGVDKTQRAFDRHAASIKSLRGLYGDAASGIREMVAESDKMERFKAGQALNDVRGRLAFETRTALETAGTTTRSRGVGEMYNLSGRFKPFEKEITDLRAQAKAGAPDIQAFQERVTDLMTANPRNEGIRAAGQSLLDMTAKAGELQRSVPGARDAVDALNRSLSGDPASSYADGLGRIVDMIPRLQQAAEFQRQQAEIDKAFVNERARLQQQSSTGQITQGQYGARTAALDARRAEAEGNLRSAQSSALSPIGRATREHELELQAIRAKSVEQQAYISREQKRLELAGQILDPIEKELRIRQAGESVIAAAAERDRTAATERTMATSERFAGARLELDAIGKTTAETERARYALDAMNEARRESYQRTGSADVSSGRADEIKKEAAAWGDLRQQIEDASRAADAVKARKLLQFGPDERSIRSQFQLDANGEIIGALNQRTAAQLRQNAAIEKTQEAYRGLGAEIVQAAKKGDLASVGKSLLTRTQSLVEGRLSGMIDDGISSGISGLFKGIPGLESAGGKRDGSSAESALFVTMGGIGAETATAAITKALGLGGGGDVRSASLAQIPGTFANDTYMPKFTGLTGGANQRVAGAFGAFNPTAAAQAIKDIESSGGNYSALGPLTRTGDRAYGAYQVMGANVGPWTEKYIGQRMTPAAFANDNRAQDAVFQGEFGRLAGKYGPEGASRAWFAGEGGMRNYNATDVVGTNVGGYGSRFGQLYGKYSAGAGSADVLTPQFQQLNTSVQQAAAAIPNMAQTATQAASGLGGLGQQATGLGGILQSMLSGAGAGGAAGGGGLGSLLGSIGGLFGFDEGGYTGDMGRGRAAGVVHGQEFVAHADATRRWRPMLEAMNAGRDPRVPMVMPVPTAAPSSSGSKVVINNRAPVRIEAKEEDDGSGGRQVRVQIEEMVDAGLKGGRARKTMKNKYGVGERVRQYG